MHKLLLFAFIIFSTPQFAQTWVQQTDAPVGRHHPISFSLNGRGYAVTGTLSNNQPTDDFFEYVPSTDTWNTLQDFPGQARSFGIGTVVNGKAYLGFGATNTSYLKDFWSYDAIQDKWTPLASCACTGRRHPALIGVGNKIYVGLGDDASGNLKDWWMYDINNNTWVQIADLPGPPRHHPFQFNAGGELYAGLGHNGNAIYKDWYKLDTATNTWTAMQDFPGEARVAGTQFSMSGFGFVLSGDGDNHSFMATGEMWRYNPTNDTWAQFPSHPGQSRWAPGSFVVGNDVYFFGGRNRLTNQFPSDLWKFDMESYTVGIKEEVLTNTFAYPNPANDIISWENDESITDVILINSLGQTINRMKADEKTIDVSALNSGIYFVQFFSTYNLIKTSKVLVNH